MRPVLPKIRQHTVAHKRCLGCLFFVIVECYSYLDFSFFSWYKSTQLHRSRLHCGNLANSICQGIQVLFLSSVWLLLISSLTLSAVPFLSLAISWRILGGPFQACQGTCHRKCLVWQAWDLLLIWSRWDVFHHQAARQVRWTTSCKTAWSYGCRFGSWKRVSGCGLMCYS